MNRYINFVLFLFTPFFLAAQGGIINNGAIIKVKAATNVKVNNAGVNNKNGGTIANTGNIYLDEDWVQSGASTSYNGLGWMWFEGGTNQNISSVSPLVIPRLRVDNGRRLILGSNITISNAVDLRNNGNIELGNFNLIANPSTSISNYDANSYIITNGTGILQQEVAGTNVVFPIGNSSFNPATLNNSGTTDNIRLRVVDQVLDHGTAGPIVTDDVVNRTWLIEETVLGGSNMTVTFQWNTADEFASFNRATSGISHHLSGSLWDNPPAYTAANNVAANTWTHTRAGFTSFSPFVVRDLEVDLPVELLSFDAKRVSKLNVDLTWSTASETNNQGFEVERMLENETSFSNIGWVDGNGTTTNTSYYDLTDKNAYSGISYYRLKQIDFDGTIAYSDIRAVREWSLGASNIDVFPNPVNDYINIRFTSKATNAQVQIYDSKGALVFSNEYAISSDRFVQINDLSRLVGGVYLIHVTTELEESYTQKFVRDE